MRCSYWWAAGRAASHRRWLLALPLTGLLPTIRPAVRPGSWHVGRPELHHRPVLLCCHNGRDRLGSVARRRHSIYRRGVRASREPLSAHSTSARHSTRNQVMRILEKNPGVVPAHPNHPRGSPDGYWVKFSVFSARCREFLPNLVSRSCQTRLRTLSVDRGGERARAHGHGVASKSPTTSGATSCGARKRQSTFPAPSR